MDIKIVCKLLKIVNFKDQKIWFNNEIICWLDSWLIKFKVSIKKSNFFNKIHKICYFSTLVFHVNSIINLLKQLLEV
jgi:hypothetical protein